MQVKLKKYGSGLGSSELARKIRFETETYMVEPVIFDFDGVSIISKEFSDELFGKMVHYRKNAFKKFVKIKNANPTIESIILTSIQKAL